ncbi:hypothetical protein HK103_000788 [Boothiomyces macroporosus]|uniref:DUF7709 domain-containing protein n=1 Tax=Boothiomyces macroporosus TaxID=261099 RepID=A0AAD5UC15_9FUNG|nr:hypothetical protein HK103_000788 [Boothiomyces macroporosus]
MTKQDLTADLKTINSKILAADSAPLPAVTLADGTKVQTGTVATMLVNIAKYNSGDQTVANELSASVPTLIKVGLFDLFPPDEWISGNNPGRSLVGKEARKYL